MVLLWVCRVLRVKGPAAAGGQRQQAEQYKYKENARHDGLGGED
jgi:hypothetical protein